MIRPPRFRFSPRAGKIARNPDEPLRVEPNMKLKASITLACAVLIALASAFAARATAGVAPTTTTAVETFVQPSLDVNGVFSVKKAPRGGTFQGAVVLGIPNGYHINSNRPTNKFMIPTSVRVTGPRGVRVGAVRYPRANVRSFAFAPDERIPVFEGNPAMRFDVTVPANFTQDRVRLRVVVSYQACSNEACFRPDTRDITLSVGVADEDDEIENINGHVFGRGRGRRK